MDSTAWKAQFAAEIERARAARAAGNEGQARVCARRAAGIAIGEYLHRQGLPLPGPSAVVRLEHLLDLPEVTPEALEIAKHLLLRVTEDFTLPVQSDLVADAEQLVQELGIDQPKDQEF
jgi:hypothetical protein